MLSIRLTKVGKKNAPSYRLVVTERRKSRDGRALEILGAYNPGQVDQGKIDRRRVEHWLEVGARATPAALRVINGSFVFKKYQPQSKAKS